MFGLHRLRQEAQASLRQRNSVEQRLLELNRQSAAARSRLLELIEQQKENISAKLSSTDSLIPPSAFSPEPAGLLLGALRSPDCPLLCVRSFL